MRTPPELFEQDVGLAPHTVTVYERADKGGVLYLRWRAKKASGPNWSKKSLGITARDNRQRLKREVLDLALKAAEEQYELLSGKRAPRSGTVHRPLTLGDTWTVLTDPKTGKFPHDSLHRRDLGRALATASRVWGPEKAWAYVDRSHWRTLTRTLLDEYNAKGKVGARSTELVLQILLGAAAWLREEERIPSDAAHPPKEWKQELREYVAQLRGGRAVTPDQPRYTLKEVHKLFAVSWDVDPRLGLALSIGAELRLGQVVRIWRRHVDVEKGRVTVQGRGKKRGAVVKLSPGQLKAIERAFGGYLRELEKRYRESAVDYPLFPAGLLRGARLGDPVATSERSTKPATKSALEAWHERAEEAAEIPHIEGRGWYGVKRLAVDEAKKAGISREGLTILGGWSDSQMADRVYAEQHAEFALTEAMQHRARLRGEEEA